MTIGIDVLFKNRKINTDRLHPFGFSPTKSGHSYSTDLLNGQFQMTVNITKGGKVSADVMDSSSQEIYVLHRVPGAAGAFVGKVREEYEGILKKIAEACFEPDVFKNEYAKQVIQYVRKSYQDELQFLWTKFPENAVYRRQDNAKWYAALLVLKKSKLGLDGDDAIDIIDLRGKPEDISALIDGKKYFPGFHMNKKNWFTICLDGSVPLEEIFHRIDESFALAKH